MSSNYNPYQVICIGNECELYDECKDECILPSKNRLKGCNYDNKCTYCSHKNKCELQKPYSDKIHELEMKIHWAELEMRTLRKYISTWRDVEKNLEDYGVKSVTDVVYYGRNEQQMIDRIHDIERLIKSYRKSLDKLS